MKTSVLGYPRIGSQRELKRASEKYWKQDMDATELLLTAKTIRRQNWALQQKAGVDFIPSNDFSLYDQVLDMSLILGCVPKRYQKVKQELSSLDLYFAMARGIQKEGYDITAMEMTKWFDTNYHYIVPEFEKNQAFVLDASKIVDEYLEAKELGIETRPVLIAPVTFLLLGKEKEDGFHRLDLLDSLLPVYFELLAKLVNLGVTHLQLDDPCLALDLNDAERTAITQTYRQIAEKFPSLKIVLTSYFECYGENLDTVLSLPIEALHLDLVRCESQLEDVLASKQLNSTLKLSLGLVDGRNVWKNDYQDSLNKIQQAVSQLGTDRVWVATSCSLLHSPCDLDLEENSNQLPTAVKNWLAFAKQKVDEVVALGELAGQARSEDAVRNLVANKQANEERRSSGFIHDPKVKRRVSRLAPSHSQRASSFSIRQAKQREVLRLPLFPTTTIGSFPQTPEVRSWRAKFKKQELKQGEYDQLIKTETEETIRFQEEIGLDVLVHGEYERNDMVEYFGEKLEGFVFTHFGWVQSYGSRCVKPPIIFGDVYRKQPMTVKWSAYAQSLTDRPVKGMLTGPVTILQWSFVRNDQPRSTTCQQIALAIRDEVCDLEAAGLKVIQIDEPAIREGLPLRVENWKEYLNWAVEAFRISASGVQDQTQIHTHMCYSEFNDIIENIADMDADVITIETSRSEMELLDAFVEFKYPNEIGPGVYDIHSPRVPSQEEIEKLLQRASELLPIEHIWVNPDCGLKTRQWPETKEALIHLVNAAKKMREAVAIEA
ncbi:5-methyltetrahydropteroyltriglutamate--homocysteine S-methyltransferase [Reichenbachiella agarivorans]|uniref:5-methyltetrahydropteroyltriglutamate--homocysteine methyltransferase n=1 Tax=Reichenbachiella agarivorans TaxID=2979464 RepID=A0ABY6CS76_9BACT|nr:5-methyltetrahydropteroyltriglutamate--homocysteine S-methyltransferase [Reichenbachiella agarivorans]UXP33346.1 5-methyltetrahydropteroyltriglutamate--homocysteine S-methyltransferase [Reichenbachiella agarivorans]